MKVQTKKITVYVGAGGHEYDTEHAARKSLVEEQLEKLFQEHDVISYGEMGVSSAVAVLLGNARKVSDLLDEITP